MAVVDIAQRTDEWHEWRKQGITASMIPVIMGLSPYKTPYELWAELVGFKEPDDLSNNYHVQRGIAQEPEARDWYENELGRPYLPVCVEADHNSLFKASLDGLFGRTRSLREVLEIKCPCEKIFNEILAMKTAAPTFKMYWSQVQWQLNVADADKGKLFFYLRKHKPISVNINRNDGFIAKAEKEALSFWKLVQTKTPPEMIKGRDKVTYHENVDDSEWDNHADSYRKLSKSIKEHEEKVKELKALAGKHEDYFKSLVPDEFQTFTKDGIRITRVDRDGATDYKKLVDLIQEKFNVVVTSEMFAQCQKDGSTSHRITVQGDSTDEIQDEIVQPEQLQPGDKPVEYEVVPATDIFSMLEPSNAQASQDKPREDIPAEQQLSEDEPLEIATPAPASSFLKSKSLQSVYF